MARLSSLAAVAVLLLAAGGARAASAQASRSCFSLSDWHGWEALGDRTLLLHVDISDVYRADLAADAPMLQWAGVHLTSIVTGPAMVCLPIDLQLQASDGEGFSEPVFVKALTKLTPAEVLALRPARRSH